MPARSRGKPAESSEQPEQASEQGQDAASAEEHGSKAPGDIAETMECDIVIVGCGTSGLVTAVEAASLGASVIALEASNMPGGGTVGIEGTLGIGSSLQKEQGIEVDKAEVLEAELEHSQWRANGLTWQDYLAASGANIDWLLENGCEYEQVDDDFGTGYFTFHRYKEDSASVGFAPHMIAKAEELGVQIVTDTEAKQLQYAEDGSICGVYATNKSGKWVQVNAKAVVLASGGFGSNPEFIARMGYDPERCLPLLQYNTGAGLSMGLDAGAMDMSRLAADNVCSCCPDLPNPHGVWESFNNRMLVTGWSFIWFNENCERFFPEDVAAKNGGNLMLQNPPQWNEKDSFILFDQGMLDAYAAEIGEDYGDIFTEAAAKEGRVSFWMADSIADLASQAGLDPQAMGALVERYNGMCENGVDTEWNKGADFLHACEQAPFYLIRPFYHVMVTIGAVGTNRSCQVIDDNKDPIPNLYAVGTDGCMLWRNLYAINVSGGISGWCVYSGRTAAQHAVENCL